MTISEKYFEKITKKRWIWEGEIVSSPSHDEIKAYGILCKYEGGLTSTNDNGKREFFQKELIEFSNKNKL